MACEESGVDDTVGRCTSVGVAELVAVGSPGSPAVVPAARVGPAAPDAPDVAGVVDEPSAPDALWVPTMVASGEGRPDRDVPSEAPEDVPATGDGAGPGQVPPATAATTPADATSASAAGTGSPALSGSSSEASPRTARTANRPRA